MNEDMIKKLDKNETAINKKSIIIITILIVLGIITGLILSSFFITEANQKIDGWNESVRKWREKSSNLTDSDINYTRSVNTSTVNDSSTNRSNSGWGFIDEIETINVFLPSVSVILVSINIFLLAGLIVTYVKVYKHTKSRYIIGLELMLIPWFILSLFLINILRSLFFASAVKFDYLANIFGFGVSGLGSMIGIVAAIQIIGLSILLYLSRT